MDIGVQYWKSRELGKKRWGKRFLNGLAEKREIRSSGDPLIGS